MDITHSAVSGLAHLFPVAHHPVPVPERAVVAEGGHDDRASPGPVQPGPVQPGLISVGHRQLNKGTGLVGQ